MADYALHPDALLEYADATTYYLREASSSVAQRFIAAVEAAVASVAAAPEIWRVVEEPGIRRYVLRRFPYVLYYRWDAKQDFVTIFAVMHCSREPGYWKHRTGGGHG
jgi:plasmid stabilization system protein ParE